VVKRAAARSWLVRLRFARPIRTARGDFNDRESVLLELRDADGVAGFGEAAPWPGFGTETAAQTLAVLTAAESLLCGEALGPGAWPPGLEDHLRTAPAARAAVEGALWDLAARRAGRPLAEQLAAGVDALHRLGGGTAQRAVLRDVPTSALLLARDSDALREEAARAREAGHRAVKIKLGAATLAEDVARARATREGLGAGVRLRGDVNGAWDRATARAALAVLADFDFDFVEQPLAADDFEGMADLHRDAPLRLAADESVATEAGALRLLAMAAVDVVVLKPATLGGPARALELAAAARRAGAEVVFSHTFESAVGARHALHCAAAWGDPSAVHGLCTAGLFVSDVAVPVECRGGRAQLSDAPGIGITP
jgi:o-succinylbenzoate synthase